MRNIRKIIVFIFSVTICLCGIFVAYSTEYTNVLASTTYTATEYTDDDYLLKADGSASTKSICDFSKEVKAAPYSTDFDELSEVIPAQYLNSTDTDNATYRFNDRRWQES